MFKNELINFNNDKVINETDLAASCLINKPAIIHKANLFKELSIETDEFEFKNKNYYFYQKVKFKLEASRLTLISMNNYDNSNNQRPLLILDFNQVTANIVIKKNAKYQFR